MMNFAFSPDDFLPMEKDTKKTKTFIFKQLTLKLIVSRDSSGSYFIEVLEANKENSVFALGYIDSLYSYWHLISLFLNDKLPD